MNDEFENALAWFCSAPAGWIQQGKKNLTAGAEWIWEVLQGDFNDNASTAQVVTGTVISMIPFVDQICDVRDLVANCRKIDHEPDESWHWVSLALTLIGLLPAVGSLVKGCLKILFAAMRRAGAKSGITPRLSLYVDEAVVQLNQFLARPEVVASLKAMKWDNPQKILAKEFRKLAARVNVSALLGALGNASQAAEHMLGLVRKWGSIEAVGKAGEIIAKIAKVRDSANRHLAHAIIPIQTAIVGVARRLEIDADMAHRAYLNSVNPHAFTKLSEADEVAVFGKAKPAWVDKTRIMAYPEVAHPPGCSARVDKHGSGSKAWTASTQ